MLKVKQKQKQKKKLKEKRKNNEAIRHMYVVVVERYIYMAKGIGMEEETNKYQIQLLLM